MQLSGIIRELPRGIHVPVPLDLAPSPALAAVENAGRLDRLFELLVRGGRGFTGGDGVYSTQLGERTLFSFGDTYVGGKIGRFRLPSPVFRNTFVRQSIGVLEPGSFQLAVPGTWSRLTGNGEYLTPPGARDQWYWPAGIVQTDAGVQLILTRFSHAPKRGLTDWQWERRGTDVATLDRATLDLLDITRITDDTSVSWGAAPLAVGDHVWAYGSAGHKEVTQQLAVARADARDIRRGWEFLTEEGTFSADASQAARLPLDVSNQFTALRGSHGGVDIIAQRGFEPALYVTHADTPVGPLRLQNAERYELPPVAHPRYVYNTIAHPQFSDAERIVVSVNHNRFDGSSFNAMDYRPRFLTVPRPEHAITAADHQLHFGQ